MKEYQTSNENLGRFISNVGRNWRSCLYVTCSVCKHKREKYCDDFLVSFDYEGRPTILTAKDAGALYGLIIDKSECIAEISNVRFLELYNKFVFGKRHHYDLLGEKFRCPLLDAAETSCDYDAYGLGKFIEPVCPE